MMKTLMIMKQDIRAMMIMFIMMMVVMMTMVMMLFRMNVKLIIAIPFVMVVKMIGWYIMKMLGHW